MKNTFAQRAMLWCALAATVSLAGCGFGHKQTLYTGNGSVSMTQGQNGQGGTVTVNGNGGSVSIGTSAVDASKLGAPIYPGATENQSGALSMSSDKGSSVTAVFNTPDDFSKVESFYKTQLPANSEKMNMSTNDGSLATFQIGDDTTPQETTVTITAKAGQPTGIMMAHVNKNATGANTTGAVPAASVEPAATAAPGTSNGGSMGGGEASTPAPMASATP